MDLHTKPRVSAVRYLNTVPLVWGMLHGAQQDLFQLDFHTPAECADRLAACAADIGIVPSIELRRQNLEILRGAGIACRGPVRSILLVSKMDDPSRIRTLATDSSSRTSVMLARILLARRYGAEPQCIAHPPDLPQMLEAADAALIIGDPALYVDPETLPYCTLDLGALWTEMTGLPMVFAVWAGHGPFAPDVAPAFVESCRFGLAHLDDIAAAEAGKRNLPEPFIRHYLTRHLTLELGPDEYRGLDCFLRYAGELSEKGSGRAHNGFNVSS